MSRTSDAQSKADDFPIINESVIDTYLSAKACEVADGPITMGNTLTALSPIQTLEMSRLGRLL
jgi:hypothetical protein